MCKNFMEEWQRKALDFQAQKGSPAAADRQHTYRPRISDEDEHLIFSLVEETREQLNDITTPFRVN